MPLTDLLQRPIAFQPILVDLTGSIKAALFLSQALYWQQRTTSEDGWFYKTQQQWWEETRLSRWDQEQARKRLVSLDILYEELRHNKQRNVTQLFFYVDLKRLESHLRELVEPPLPVPDSGNSGKKNRRPW